MTNTLLPMANSRNYNHLNRLDSSLSDVVRDIFGIKDQEGNDSSLLNSLRSTEVFTDEGLDWKENTDNFTLKLDVPGFKLSEIDVDFNEGKLVVTAESKRSGYENKFYKEIYVSNFERVDAEKANAKLEDGVLQITLPKSEKTKGRKIVVQ